MPGSTTSRPSASCTSSPSRASGCWRSPRPATCRSRNRSSACCRRAWRTRETGELETIGRSPTMFRAAQLVGRAIRHVRATDEDRPSRRPSSRFDVSMLFGGQIKGGPMRLFMIYAAGNFIECGAGRALPADRRAQIRQADPRPRGQLHDRPLRRAEDRPDLDGFDHALEPRRRPADRHRGHPPRRARARAGPPHRGRRALFPRSARALVGGAAGRPHGDPAPALRPSVQA